MSWPTEIRVRERGAVLSVVFEDGRRHDLPAELLRVESPSAEVQGHGPGEKKLVAGKRHVRIADVEPIGNYAVKLAFDDGHTTGIYSWTTLAGMGERADELMAAYEGELAAAGLAR